MGLDDMLIWNVYHGELKKQRKRTSRAAIRASRRSSRLEERIDALEQRHDRLSLVTQALWELVKRDRGLDDAALTAVVRELDLADGVLDGKTPETVCVCPECSQVMSVDHETCLYCGADKLDTAPFEGL